MFGVFFPEDSYCLKSCQAAGETLVQLKRSSYSWWQQSNWYGFTYKKITEKTPVSHLQWYHGDVTAAQNTRQAPGDRNRAGRGDPGFAPMAAGAVRWGSAWVSWLLLSSMSFFRKGCSGGKKKPAFLESCAEHCFALVRAKLPQTERTSLGNLHVFSRRVLLSHWSTENQPGWIQLQSGEH